MILFIKENSSLARLIKKEGKLPEASNDENWWYKYKYDCDIDSDSINKKGYFKFNTAKNCLA